MFKKLSAAFVALSLVAIAQPVLAQEVSKPGKIASITQATSSLPATMKIANDQDWKFIEAPAQPATKIIVQGKPAKVSDLKVGMMCYYVGTLPKAYLSTVVCSGFSVTITAIAPKTSNGRGSVTDQNGIVWTFGPGATATLKGAPVDINSFTSAYLGMACLINGTRWEAFKATLDSIDCKTAQ